MSKESKAIPKALLMRRLRAERRAKGLVDFRVNCTPDQRRKLVLYFERLQRLGVGE